MLRFSAGSRTPIRFSIGLVFVLAALGLAQSAFAISAPIQIAGTDNEGVLIHSEANEPSIHLGWMPEGASPEYNCFTHGEMVGTVSVWFSVTYSGITGFYPSFYDNSSYASDAELTEKYGIKACGPMPSSSSSPSTSPPASSSHPSTPSCYGDYCSGKDPMASRCASGSKTLAAKELSGARLELRWSSKCKTEWARWIQYPEGLKSDLPVALSAVQDTGYRQTANYDVNGDPENSSASSTSGGITTSWTPMIYSPVHLVRAVAIIQCGSDSLLGTAVDCALNGKVETAAK